MVRLAPTSPRLQQGANLPQLLGGKLDRFRAVKLDAFEVDEKSVESMEPSHASSFFSSNEMENLFREVFDASLSDLGFQFVGKSRWIRETNAGFKHLFYFYPLRPGADYFPYGALSFDYVPRIEAGKLRIRTDAKHARVHLAVTDVGFGSDKAIERNRTAARQKCLKLHSTVVDAIKTSLTPIISLGDALERLRSEKARSGISFYHYPETALSYAFTLAKTGHKGEAESELTAVLQKQSSHFPSDTHEQIRRLLAE